MNNPYDILQERGFIYQCTDEQGLRGLFQRERVTAYIGFDATAVSLHVGSLVPIMALRWLQETGHQPVVIVGGGTTMVGDPSGKTEARKLLSREDIRRNMEGQKKQFARYISFDEDQALMIDNGDWLLSLNYIDFLREIGRHFSVNRMLAAESYKMRLESGLSFIEFNYMLLQAYDFLVLYQERNNKLQMGGQDQWGNITAGIDLIRRVTGGEAFGLTFPLLEDPKTGAKFGKTHKGAIWLDAELTSPYEFFQFWRNTDDQSVGKYLALFTMLPMDDVQALGGLEGNLINRAKEILAWEVTALCHGQQEATEALAASIRTFGSADPKGLVKSSSKISNVVDISFDDHGPDFEISISVELPTTDLTVQDLTPPPTVADLFVLAGLSKSKGEARKLIRAGGAWINGVKVEREEQTVSTTDLQDGALVLRAGKKRYHRLSCRS